MDKKLSIAITAIVSLATGALLVVLLARSGVVPLGQQTSLAPVERMAAPNPASLPVATDAVVNISPDALGRMHLSYARVAEEVALTDLRVPGTVQPNAYKEVRVTSLVGGVVRHVSAELGQTVKRGQPLAIIFSRDLAEAQAEYLGFQAQLEAEHKKLLRTQELVGLGAASKQELEEVEASHQVHTSHVEQSYQRLLLLGLNESQVEKVRSGRTVSSEIPIPAPSDGLITARSLNPGQVVTAGQETFIVTDLTTVWVEANVLEDDFATVKQGISGTMTSPAYPGRTYRGTVDYVDPRVDPQTRTAKVRIIVENQGLTLRLGMYLDVQFARAGAPNTAVPSQAIQMIGDSSFVYVPMEGQNGQFRQVKVVVGAGTKMGRQVTGSVRAGEQIVTEGSFLLRAEAIRQNLR